MNRFFPRHANFSPGIVSRRQVPVDGRDARLDSFAESYLLNPMSYLLNPISFILFAQSYILFAESNSIC